MIFGTPEYDELLRQVMQGGENAKRHDLYKTTCEGAKKMAVHIYGEKPTEILCRTRPREPDEIKKYREDNYEATTKATASKALSIVAKIFNPSLSTIRWKDQSANGKELEKYLLEYYPRYNSVIKFLSQAGLKRMIADPNGVFAVRPKKFPTNQLEKLQPDLKIFGSESVWYYDDDHFLIYIKNEKENGKEWFYFQYYDAVQVIDFRTITINSKQIEIQIDQEYNHNTGEIPVWFLTGETETEPNGMEYYTSFFEPALPFWNKAINHESDLDAAFINHLHPQKVVVAEDCDYIDPASSQRCQHGKIPNPDGEWTTCPRCNGAGRFLPVGPFGIHMVAKEKLSEGQQLNVPVQYVTVPTDPTKMLKERVDELHRKGLEALNMDIIDDVGENQSGIAKVIDRGELYDFLYKISDVMFDTHLQNIVYFSNKLMFGVQDSNPGRNSDKNLPEINKPVNFDLTSVPEMTKEYSESKKATVNPEVLRQKQIDIVSKEYATTPDVKRKITTVLELDPLPEISAVDMEMKLSLGTISKKDAVLHDNILQFVDRAIREHKDAFYSMQKDEKVDLMNEYADEFIAANKVTLTVMEDDAEETNGEPGRKVA